MLIYNPPHVIDVDLTFDILTTIILRSRYKRFAPRRRHVGNEQIQTTIIEIERVRDTRTAIIIYINNNYL